MTKTHILLSFLSLTFQRWPESVCKRQTLDQLWMTNRCVQTMEATRGALEPLAGIAFWLPRPAGGTSRPRADRAGRLERGRESRQVLYLKAVGEGCQQTGQGKDL